jgi:EAL domain-containing protein (putative c-di-GMP-specific phosphodiesterase class I)
VLHKLRGLGVPLSLDDFGTDHSTVSDLKRLRVATLKIDRAFVRDITHDADSVATVGAIVAVAHSLKLKVIAEGVETAEQLASLRAHGGDEMQGFVVGKPLPAAEFAIPLQHHGARSGSVTAVGRMPPVSGRARSPSAIRHD